MTKVNHNLMIKIVLIGISILILFLTFSIYFSDLNIGNKIGFGKPVTTLIK